MSNRKYATGVRLSDSTKKSKGSSRRLAESRSEWGLIIELDEESLPVKEYVLQRASKYFSKRYGFYVLVKDEIHHEVTHRVGGPAIISPVCDDSEISFFINGYQYFSTKRYCKACGFDDETTMYWVLKYGERLPVYASQI